MDIKSMVVNNARRAVAFTLAEILITLAIIGIVAALTIPVLIANTNSQKFRSQYKKTLSTLNQAVKMNVAQNEWDFTGANAQELRGSNCTDSAKNTHSICALFNNNLKGFQWNTYKASTGTVDENSTDTYHIDLVSDIKDTTVGTYLAEANAANLDLADGSAVILQWGLAYTTCTDSEHKGITKDRLSDNNDLKKCVALIDVNGKQAPNKEVTCANNVTTAIEPNKPCVVNNKTMGDIFPVVFYDEVIAPATNAASYVLSTSK